MQKGRFQKAFQFAENKGFYIILGLCVIAIGVSGYVLFFTGEQGAEEDVLPVQQSSMKQEKVSENVPDVTVPKKEPAKKEEQTITPQPPKEKELQQNKPEVTTDSPQKTNAVQVGGKTEVKQPVFALPVREAEILRAFSGDQLLFDETMGDWRTHNGTDFACDEGDEVLAVMDGTVEKVSCDAMLGNCVVIDHGAGLQSLTCGLASADGVKTGAKISAGQMIGRAGKSMPAESAQDSHIHLEMRENGKLVDPMSVLKIK